MGFGHILTKNDEQMVLGSILTNHDQMDGFETHSDHAINFAPILTKIQHHMYPECVLITNCPKMDAGPIVTKNDHYMDV